MDSVPVQAKQTLKFIITDCDELYKETFCPTLLNNVPYITKEDRTKFTEMLLTTYDTDILSTVPSCSCGEVKNGFNLGKICGVCNTAVTYQSESDIDLKTWIKVPEGVDGFILPVIYYDLCTLIGSGGFNILEYWLNPKVKLPNRMSKSVVDKLNVLEQSGIPRGLNNFIRNIDTFIQILPKLGGPKAHEYCSLLANNKEKIFPKYLPMPTKSMLIVEQTQLGNYADTNAITGAIDAARTIASLNIPRQHPLTQNALESKIVGVISSLKQYYTAMIKDSFCSKKGWLRGQIFSSRSHFCARAVITSISEPHHYQEVHIPYITAMELFKVHIESKLMHKYDFSKARAMALVESSGNMFVPLLYNIMEELIAESYEIEYMVKEDLQYYTDMGYTPEQIAKLKRPKTGIPVISQRNPTLGELSAQFNYITKVKKDLFDKTISISVLTLRGHNADFDGDTDLYIL